MAIKLFVSDVDGTLLNDDRKITPKVKSAIQQAVADGMVFTIATGRMYTSVCPFVRELNIDVPLIVYNGAMIVNSKDGSVMYADYLKKDLIHEILDFCKENDLHVNLYSDDKLYFAEESICSLYYEYGAKVKGTVLGDKVYEMVDNVPKMLIVVKKPTDIEPTLEKLHSHFGDRLTIVQSAPYYIELISGTTSKDRGIFKLAELLGIDKKDILAIGDSGNDETMLRNCAYGVAMGNATEGAKKAAKYHVASNIEDGLAEAIDRFFYDK